MQAKEIFSRKFHDRLNTTVSSEHSQLCQISRWGSLLQQLNRFSAQIIVCWVRGKTHWFIVAAVTATAVTVFSDTKFLARCIFISTVWCQCRNSQKIILWEFCAWISYMSLLLSSRSSIFLLACLLRLIEKFFRLRNSNPVCPSLEDKNIMLDQFEASIRKSSQFQIIHC